MGFLPFEHWWHDRWVFRQYDWGKVIIHPEPRDAWIGIYWDRSDHHWYSPTDMGQGGRDKICIYDTLDIYVCVIPFIPIHFKVDLRWWRGEDGR